MMAVSEQVTGCRQLWLQPGSSSSCQPSSSTVSLSQVPVPQPSAMVKHCGPAHVAAGREHVVHRPALGDPLGHRSAAKELRVVRVRDDHEGSLVVLVLLVDVRHEK